MNTLVAAQSSPLDVCKVKDEPLKKCRVYSIDEILGKSSHMSHAIGK